MSTSRRSFVSASMPRRPVGPRCHGGASSLLRLGFGAAPQRALPPRVSGWLEMTDSFDASRVEHVVGWPGRDARLAALAS